jgi:hypothetical protein
MHNLSADSDVLLLLSGLSFFLGYTFYSKQDARNKLQTCKVRHYIGKENPQRTRPASPISLPEPRLMDLQQITKDRPEQKVAEDNAEVDHSTLGNELSKFNIDSSLKKAREYQERATSLLFSDQNIVMSQSREEVAQLRSEAASLLGDFRKGKKQSQEVESLLADLKIKLEQFHERLYSVLSESQKRFDRLYDDSKNDTQMNMSQIRGERDILHVEPRKKDSKSEEDLQMSALNDRREDMGDSGQPLQAKPKSPIEQSKDNSRRREPGSKEHLGQENRVIPYKETQQSTVDIKTMKGGRFMM